MDQAVSYLTHKSLTLSSVSTDIPHFSIDHIKLTAAHTGLKINRPCNQILIMFLFIHFYSMIYLFLFLFLILLIFIMYLMVYKLIFNTKI